MRGVRLAGAVAIGAGIVAGWAVPAWAQSGTFRATPTSGPPGTTISVSSVTPCVLPAGVTGSPFGRITLSRGSTVLASGDFPALSSGSWSGTLTVPSGTTAGAATLGADCQASQQAEGSLVHYDNVSFIVTSGQVSGATTSPTGQPWAGSAPYVGAAFGLGLGLVGLGYRRRRFCTRARLEG